MSRVYERPKFWPSPTPIKGYALVLKRGQKIIMGQKLSTVKGFKFDMHSTGGTPDAPITNHQSTTNGQGR